MFLFSVNQFSDKLRKEEILFIGILFGSINFWHKVHRVMLNNLHTNTAQILQ